MKTPKHDDQGKALDKDKDNKGKPEHQADRDAATGKTVPTQVDTQTGVAVRTVEAPGKVVEPNWDSLGDKELVSIIQSRTGELVVPGRMAHAVLLQRAQDAFRNGAGPDEDRQEHRAVRPLTGNPRMDTVPQSGHRPAGEIAESASGRPLDEAHPERRAIGDEAAGKPLTPPADASKK